MKRVTLPKDVWVSLYGRLHDILSKYMLHSDIDGKEAMDDDVRDEVLNIMNEYFDRGFKTGITEETQINVHN